MDMQVIFEDAHKEPEVIGEFAEATLSDADRCAVAFQVILTFLGKNNYKAPYIRWWSDENETTFDVGSHTEFFYVRPPLEKIGGDAYE